MFDELNAQQRAAVEHQDSPLLIVAGAGTGKTKTLAARVCRILDDGADPTRILLLTFTRRAAAEMLRRVAAVSDQRAASQIFGGTFHAAAHRLLHRYGDALGLPTGFTVLDHSDSTDLLGVVRTEEKLGEQTRRFPRRETIAGIYSRMVSNQRRLDDVLESDYPWCADHDDALKAIFAAYTQRKRQYSMLDYDDLLLFWRGLTTSNVGDHLRSTFDHILIDEYQDTNTIQADIIEGMARPGTDICAVGDDAQAIYGFRAATVENMWSFTDRFAGATRITLEQNYRSTMPILDVANAVLAQSNDHFDKALWSNRTEGIIPTLRTHYDEAAQSQSVATSILDCRERGIDLRDQAVLFRAGHHSAGLELELTQRDIPFVKYGGLKYLETSHIKDLLALLRILDNPADQLAWHRILSTLDGVGPATVRRVCTEIGLGPDNDTALIRFLDGAGEVPAAAELQTTELRVAFAACLGPGSSESLSPAQQIDRLKDFCAMVFPNRYDNASARLADIAQLAGTAAAYRDRGQFLVDVTLDPPGRTSEHAGPPHLDDDWMTLSTVHSAKGLEWRSVHIIHAADGNFPSEMSLGDNEGLAEELRLFYVALTRAKDELTINFPLRFHVHRHATNDRHVYAQLSRFVEPIRHLVDEQAPPHQSAVDKLHIGSVGVAEEIDAQLSALWD